VLEVAAAAAGWEVDCLLLLKGKRFAVAAAAVLMSFAGRWKPPHDLFQ